MSRERAIDKGFCKVGAMNVIMENRSNKNREVIMTIWSGNQLWLTSFVGELIPINGV